MLIYLAENIFNKKKYIGKTRFSLEKRKEQHEVNARKGRSGYFYNALRRYGKEAFIWKILEDNIDNNNLLDELEFHYIIQYNSLKEGYNLTLGGEGLSCLKGFKLEDLFGKEKAEEIKIKQSNSRKGKKKPKEFSEKVRKRQIGNTNSMYGKRHSRGSIQKMSKATSGKNNGFYGKKHTEETREKISKKSKQWWENLSESELNRYKKKMSQSLKGKNKPQKRVTCPYCNKEGGTSNMKRYHFENCKFKEDKDV